MTDLSDKLEAAEAAQESGEGKPRRTIVHLVEAQRDQIERALPNTVSPDRLVRVALTTLRTTPKLTQCTPESFLGALMLSAQLGLEPGPLGHAYFVPRWNKHLKANEVTFLLGYRGLIDLARRSDEITSIEARSVFDDDDFDFEHGSESYLRHKPNLRKRKGSPWAYYGVAKFRGGGHYFEVLNRDDIEGRRGRSAAKDTGPWKTDYDAMARKSVIRAMAPYLPLTVHAAQALAQDETVHTSISRDMLDEMPALGSGDESTGGEGERDPQAEEADPAVGEPEEAQADG